MNLIRYNNPFTSDLMRLFDEPEVRLKARRPAVNITESDDQYEILVMAPGRDKSVFNIACSDGKLEISYTSDTTENSSEDKAIRQEFTLTDFTRVFEFDSQLIDEDGIKGQYEDGLLRLTLPKRELHVNKEPRLIEVA